MPISNIIGEHRIRRMDRNAKKESPSTFFEYLELFHVSAVDLGSQQSHRDHKPCDYRLLNPQGSFTVTTTGLLTPTISYTGTLPSGLSFIDNGNGTATIAGTVNVVGTYYLTIIAQMALSRTRLRISQLEWWKAARIRAVALSLFRPA